MTNAFTNATLSNRTFGVEIETTSPVSANDVAAAIMAVGIDCRVAGYTHAVTRHWKIVSDMSVNPRGAMRYGFEVVSPILSGEAGLAEVRKVCDALKAAGCQPNVSTGLHVHVFARDLSLDHLKRVAKNYVKFEKFFDYIMPASRRGDYSRWVKSNKRVHGDYNSQNAEANAFDAINAANRVSDLIRVVSPNRYYKLNMVPLENYGTVEFRQHSGTVEADKVCNWITMMVQFVEAAKHTAPRKRTVNQNIELAPTVELDRFFKMFRTLKTAQTFYRARMAHFIAQDRH